MNGGKELFEYLRESEQLAAPMDTTCSSLFLNRTDGMDEVTRHEIVDRDLVANGLDDVSNLLWNFNVTCSGKGWHK
jgi:hypothetical protein